jgi:cytochrome b
MMVRIWDPLVRIFHWGLVASFAIAWITAENLKVMHEWAGYAAAALIGFRLIWGLIGPRYARFSQFVKSPSTVMAYLRDIVNGSEPRYLGHNPAGGAMILALLAGIGATAWTGWLLTIPRYEHMDIVKEGHDIVASLLMILVLAHIAGVLWASAQHGENLTRSMVTGKKRAAEHDDIS